jgi:hypothetical protein
VRFSAAFVAVVTLRDTPRYLCSVPGKYFPETAHTVYFNRSQLTGQATR